jgi:GxxExxY protein
MSDLLFRNETYQIIGGCMTVYKDKGHGFVEPVYQDCMEIELEHLKVPFLSQVNLPLTYRQIALKHTYIPDLLCFGEIIVELKAVKQLADEHRAQVLNYLKASGLQLGLLVNFGHYPGLEWERIVLTKRQSNT